jgi:predicted secreted protein
MALAGVGAEFKRSATDSSASTYAAIGEVNSITGPNMSREFIDTTALDTSGGYRTFIPSFRDGGEITLDVNFERDNYIDFKDDFESADGAYYQIVFPDTGSTTFEFFGYVTSLGNSIPKDDKIIVSVTIKISGQVTVSS